MQDHKLYERLLGIECPWRVREVELRLEAKEVRVHVELEPGAPLACPQCGAAGASYDTRERRWRHLDTMQYRTVVVAKVPRVRCEAHGIHQLSVPWADPGSRFTALFEALVIDWLKETSFAAVARMLSLTWAQVAGVQARAVRRGLSRRTLTAPRRIGVDETSFQKRHEYVTVVNDLDHEECVLHVADDRTEESLAAFYRLLGEPGCQQIEVVAMDMWQGYMNATHAHVPDAERKIAFDKFHIAQHLGNAVDRVRRKEHRTLRAEGDERLTGTKYVWLKNPWRMSRAQWRDFGALRNSHLRVARAWAIKELAMSLWGYLRRSAAERGWERWYSWAVRCRLEPMREVARMIKKHWQGVMNAVVSGVTNARSEATNAKIQWIKRKACGYRNRERFRNAIYFHLGGLDLYPYALRSTHTKS